ncbi:MAG: hypothetical protein O3B72_05340 [Proteobacteria bacterium]|nr:hypothetical protein [Pseudomonadota bacterium]
MMRFLMLTAMLITFPVAAEPTASEVSRRLEAAEAVYEQARAAQNSWVMTPRLISEARQALAADDVETAAELAERAYRSARASVEQAEREKLAWRGRVPTN